MSQPFKKFIQQGESGAKKKERIRQEKKKVRQETKEYFEKKKQEAREARAHGAGYKPQGTGNKAQDTRHEGTRHKAQGTGNKAQGAGFRAEGPGNKPKPAGFKQKPVSDAKPVTHNKPELKKKVQKTESQPQTTNNKPQPSSGGGRGDEMPLNKFIAHAGVCSRRDAAELVKAGKVIVNGVKITEPGHKVTDQDEIKVNGKKLFIRKNLVYILINKPKDYITTTEDPQGRKTVLDIIRNATPERVYPIGRLDRNTTGVLLLTNDGELAQKLSHPSYEIKKIYEVKLDKPLVKKDFDAIMNGVTLEDGFVAPDSLAFADPKDKSVIGIEIHSGRNRIVRRIFEHLGYDVRNLDRVMYANLTKKNVDRGKWRFLTEKEVRLLKYLNASYTKNKTATRG
jgi:23S rRNA pseudouridine2605 synthase